MCSVGSFFRSLLCGHVPVARLERWRRLGSSSSSSVWRAVCLLTGWSDLVIFLGRRARGKKEIEMPYLSYFQIKFRSHGNLRTSEAHTPAATEAGVYLSIECDLMHCELDVTWESFVKITNYRKSIYYKGSYYIKYWRHLHNLHECIVLLYWTYPTNAFYCRAIMWGKK